MKIEFPLQIFVSKISKCTQGNVQVRQMLGNYQLKMIYQEAMPQKMHNYIFFGAPSGQLFCFLGNQALNLVSP